MRSFINIKAILGNLYFWSLLWLELVVCYFLSIKYSYHIQAADYVVYTVQMIADACIGLFSFLAYKKATEIEAKKFYLLLFLSLIPGLTANESYNILINIMGVQNIAKVQILWVLPYLCFLIIQIFSWSYLVYRKKESRKLATYPWVLKFLYLQTALIVLSSILFTALVKGINIDSMGLIQAADSLLEIILFILLSICLSRAKNKSLSYIGFGFLFLIAFNLAHRFSYLSGNYYKTFDMAWLICLLVIIFGFARAVKNNKEKLDFFARNSIHVLSSAIFIAFATFMLLIYILFGFFISSMETNNIGSLNIPPENIPAVLVFSFSLSILAGKFVANYFSRPLETVFERINLIQKNQLPTYTASQMLYIDEVEKLDRFILTTIEQLQIANQVKSKFLMDMSHDFRTPASGIYHMSRSIYRRIVDPSLKDLQKLLVESSEQLMNYLDEVLDYSRLDSSMYKQTVEAVDVHQVINEIIQFVTPKTVEKHLTIHTSLLSSAIICRTDRVLTHRILLNVISNAIKFTDKGSIVISTTIKSKELASWAAIAIKDSGIGIDAKHHRLIFEPFYRIESEETAKYQGIGLGLSNVNLMLKQIGGSIAVESSLGKGTTFIIYLPLQTSG